MTNDRKNRAARAEQMRKEREKAERRQRNLISVVIVAVVVVLIGVGAWAVTAAQQDNKKETEVVEPENTIEDFGVPYVPSGGETAGDDVPTVEIFEDFLCPYCQQFEQSSGETLRAQADAGEIQLVYRPFSFLDDMGGSSNEYSLRATNLAMCVLDEQGPEAFQTVHDALYANQPPEGGAGPSDAELISLAEDAGVEVSKECVTQQRFGKWVQAARDHGQDERGVSGTPTVFVNGEEVQDLSDQAIADAIEAARQG